MAHLFSDSFDHYATADRANKWQFDAANGGFSINSSNGRRSSGCGRFNRNTGLDYLARNMSIPATSICGFALHMPTLQTTTLWGLRSSDGFTHIYLVLNADGSLQVYRGNSSGGSVMSSGTSLGTTASAVIGTAYAYVEIKSKIDASTGTIDIHVNGASVLSLSSQNTKNASAGATTSGQLMIGVTTSPAQIVDFDDLYVIDTTGAVNNTFLGDIRVDAHVTTANGSTSNSTPSTGSNRALNVDDATPNDDTDYNTLAASGDKDTLVLQDLIPTGSAILAMQTVIYAKKTDAGVASVAPVIRTASTDFDGTGVPLSTAYTYYLQSYDVDPNTGVQPTETNFNAYELGYKRTA